MSKLNKLIDLNKLQKLNRKKKLEEKLRQQEYYGDIEELFDPLNKVLNTNSEAWHAPQNQTLEALTYNTNVLKALDPQQQSNSFNDRAVTLIDDRDKTFTVDNDMADILLEERKQTIKQFELISFDANSNKFKLNCIDVTLVPDGIKMKGSVYDFSKGFHMFITNKDVTEKDIKGDKKVKQFLKDIGYKQRGDTKSNRPKIIRRMFASNGEPSSQVISIPNYSEDEKYQQDNSDDEEETDYETDKQIEAGGLRNPNPNNLVERVELLIIETKAGHDGLYDEMLDISKQLLSRILLIKDN